ncbi:CBS domain-containing protein [Salinirubellus salinus]|uniref:CBS domain-containing protein n=1 Tax=Salinirubellus salinus TaxID=1364945 RepID=A0A9E7U6K4_9EURY|nr:CBS domain-containing protein [Salinirubellus salinus]UWM56565.1 CBS domain-containing protein [Salinirubellus salinus]
MRVADLLTADLVTVGVGASLADAAQAMLRAGVGSVVVTDDGTPVGIVTTTDTVRAALEAGAPLERVPVRAAMSSPVEPVGPDTSVERLAEAFRRHGVKRLLVRDGLAVHGIVSVSDLAAAQGDIHRELVRSMDRRREWER